MTTVLYDDMNGRADVIVSGDWMLPDPCQPGQYLIGYAATLFRDGWWSGGCNPIMTGGRRRSPTSRDRDPENADRRRMSKQCRMCSRTRPVEAFNREPNAPDGLKPYCKVCQRVRRKAIYWRDPESARAYTRQWKAANIDRYPHYRRRAKYGLEPEDYEAMLREQDGKCRICAGELPLVVDHNPATGLVRGLLCDRCNRGLGFFDHDPDRFLAAAAYLISASEREAVDA